MTIFEVNHKCDLRRKSWTKTDLNCCAVVFTSWKEQLNISGFNGLQIPSVASWLRYCWSIQTAISPSPDLCERKFLLTCIFVVSQLYRRVRNTKSMKALLMSLKRVGSSKKEPMTTQEGKGKRSISKFSSRFYKKWRRTSRETWSPLDQKTKFLRFITLNAYMISTLELKLL